MKVLVLTDRAQTCGRGLVDVVRGAVDGGAQVVVLREKDLQHAQRADLAERLRAFVPTLLIASDPTIDGDGVHLSASDPFPDPRPTTVGRSCHTADELAAAAAEGCDYATLSPVFASRSKPGYGPTLGVEALKGAPLPVYALGGVDATNARSCIAAGASGVAVMGHVMRAADPAAAIRKLCK